MKMEQEIAELEQEIAELEPMWIDIGTNEGTYGSSECCRKVGCGDPRYGNVHVYVQVGSGCQKWEGPDPEDMPGRIRWSRENLADAKKQLADAKKQLAKLRRA
jgi:hypothetical protein